MSQECSGISDELRVHIENCDKKAFRIMITKHANFQTTTERAAVDLLDTADHYSQIKISWITNRIFKSEIYLRALSKIDIDVCNLGVILSFY